MIKDINAGSGSLLQDHLIILNKKLYSIDFDDVNGRKLCVKDSKDTLVITNKTVLIDY
ncbi:MAG: hypothetical protein AB8B78_06390 [Polaribacter sp.]